jgi:hypothetical protein
VALFNPLVHDEWLRLGDGKGDAAILDKRARLSALG